MHSRIAGSELYTGQRITTDSLQIYPIFKSDVHCQLSEMRDYRTNEVNELNNQLVAARNEVSMQGALIIALTRKVTYLEKAQDEAQLQCKTTVDAVRKECDQQLTQMSLARDSAAATTTQQQHAHLMRRAVLAEAEVSKLKASLITAMAAVTDSQLQETMTRLEDEKKKMAEDVKCLREENARLEKQAELLSADLKRHRRQSRMAATAPLAVSPSSLASPKLSPAPARELGRSCYSLWCLSELHVTC